MAEGQRLETQPVAELVGSVFDTKYEVLVPDAVDALAIDAGLVGRDHPREDGRAVEVLADVLGAFVDSEEESHPVAGAVAEVAAGAPQRAARKRVQLAARRPPREHRHRQVYMAFQDQSIVLLLKKGAEPEGHGARDVGGAVHILSAAVDEIQPARLQHGSPAARGDIVRQRRAVTVGGNGLEAVSSISRDLCAKGTELAGGLPFVDGPAAPDRLLEPVQEAFHRHSVVDVDVSHPFDLLGVLDGFAQRHGRVPFKDGPFDGIGLQEMVEVIIEGGRINGNARDDAVLHLARKGEGDVVIRKDGDAVVTKLAERIPCVGIRLASLGHEPFDGVAGDKEVRYD